MEEVSIKICTAGKKIGYVSQSTILLDDDIKNNIAFGVPAEQIDEKKLLSL